MQPLMLVPSHAIVGDAQIVHDLLSVGEAALDFLLGAAFIQHIFPPYLLTGSEEHSTLVLVSLVG